MTCIVFTKTIQCQDPQFINIDKTKGLPSNSVYDIFQDTKGFMWFSCDKGLVKYDGFEFKTYYNKNQSSKSGTNIQEDKFGRIWYQNFDGYVFYIENDTLRSLHSQQPNGYYKYGFINNKLFVTNINCVAVYDLKTLNKIHHIKINTNQISFAVADSNYYYVYNNTQLLKISGTYSIDKIAISDELVKNGYGMLLSIDNTILIYARDFKKFKNCFYVNHNSIQPKFNIELNNVQNAAFTNNQIWFCTTNGAYQYDSNYYLKNNTNCFLEDYNISDVFYDREGNYWFSTINNGLLFVKDINTKLFFKTINPLKITSNKNNLIISTNNGQLYETNKQTKIIRPIFKDDLNPEISTLFYDSINKKTIISNRFIEILNADYKLQNKMHGALKNMRIIDSNFYAFAISGACILYKINPNKTSKWQNIYDKNLNKESKFASFLNGCRAKAVEYNSKIKTIYFGTSYGLYALTPDGTSEIKNDTNKIYCNYLCQFNNTIYGLTASNEIFKIQNNQLSFVNILKDETINHIKICNNILFISTNNNLYSLNLTTNLLVHQHHIDYDISDIELQNDQLILVTKEGLLFEKFKSNSNINENPLFYFNSLLANGISQNINKTINLNYNQNNIEINYSILSFKTAFSYPLYYKINNSNWELLSTQLRSIKLSALTPDDYTILFKLGDPKSDLHKPVKIHFHINNPFWKTWWFIILLVAVLIVVVLLLAKWRIGELQQKNKLLNDKLETEQKYYHSTLKAIRAQMNPHFFYNALNTIQSFIFSNDKRNAATYLAKFSKLTRLILEMSEKESNPITVEVTALQLYLDIEKVRFNDDFDFEIITSNNLLSNEIFIPPMLIQPYVENAIKHGLLHKKGRKHLCIEFKKNEQDIIVVVEDNGVGRKVSKELNEKKLSKHQSFSTAANQHRLDILNKETKQDGVLIIDKTDEFNNANGTKVILTIPFSTRH